MDGWDPLTFELQSRLLVAITGAGNGFNPNCHRKLAETNYGRVYMC